MDLNDRFMKGFIAGIAAGIVHDTLDIISNLMNIDKLTYFDWGGIAVFGSKPDSLIEWIVAIFAKTLLTGFLGVIFAYLIPKVTSRNYVFKCIIFSLAVWEAIFSTVLVFKIDKLVETDASSAASDALTTIIYGIIFAVTYDWLDKRHAASH